MTAEQYIKKLFELSTKKLDGLTEILNLTEEQSIVINEDSAHEIEKLIGLKQIQMDIIDEVDEAFEVYYSRLKSMLGVQSLEEIKMTELNGAAALKQIVTSIFEIIKQIQRVENENNKKVRDILDKLGNDIKRIKQSKVANNGYNVASKLPQPSYYFDKKK